MSATIEQTMNILVNLDEDNKSFVLDFVKLIEKKQLSEKELRNAMYVDKIQRGINQCKSGQGLKRDIIEVSDDE
jgi:hypothetical protein